MYVLICQIYGLSFLIKFLIGSESWIIMELMLSLYLCVIAGLERIFKGGEYTWLFAKPLSMSITWLSCTWGIGREDASVWEIISWKFRQDFIWKIGWSSTRLACQNENCYMCCERFDLFAWRGTFPGNMNFYLYLEICQKKKIEVRRRASWMELHFAQWPFPLQAMFHDFSTENIQIDKDYSAKLSGYGCVSHISEIDLFSNSVVSTFQSPSHCISMRLLELLNCKEFADIAQLYRLAWFSRIWHLRLLMVILISILCICSGTDKSSGGGSK